jgi:hypothetical protein
MESGATKEAHGIPLTANETSCQWRPCSWIEGEIPGALRHECDNPGVSRCLERGVGRARWVDTILLRAMKLCPPPLPQPARATHSWAAATTRLR